jgi:chromate transporter
MNKNLRYLFIKFLKIGATSWGGYMALIAMIQKQISERDKAIEEEKIIHAVSLASVLPGPVAVNVVAYIGYQMKGIKGALVSMTAVLIPCFILMLVLSYVYFSYGNVPAFNNFFAGVTPCIAALLISVAFTMAKKNIKDVVQIIIAVLALLSILFIHSAYSTILVIICSGIVGYFIYREKNSLVNAEKNHSIDLTPTSHQREGAINFLQPNVSIVKKYFLKISIAALAVFVVLITVYFLFDEYSFTHLYKRIILTFSGISISQFGGGYVVIPALQKIIVDSLHWLNIKEFTDAIAMGQITPGPIYISAAFIGYKLDGVLGAAVSTIAIYLPAACIMLVCARFMNSIITSPVIKAAFKGITAAVTGMIAAAGCTILYKSQSISIFTISIFIISLILFIKFKLSPVYIIPLAGITGLFIFKN